MHLLPKLHVEDALLLKVAQQLLRNKALVGLRQTHLLFQRQFLEVIQALCDCKTQQDKHK